MMIYIAFVTNEGNTDRCLGSGDKIIYVAYTATSDHDVNQA